MITPTATILLKYFPFFLGIQLNKTVSICWSNSFLRVFLYYYLGLLLGNHIIELNYRTSRLVILYFVSIIIQIIESILLYKTGMSSFSSQTKLSVFFTASIFVLLAYKFIEIKTPLKENMIVKLGGMIGDYSFGIYLCHMVTKYALIKYVPLYNWLPFGINSLVIVFVSLIAVLMGKRMFG